MANTDGIFVLTQEAVLAHPHLFEPRAFMRNGKPEGEPKFDCNLVFKADHPDVPEMKKLLAAVARARRPNVDFKTIDLPFKNGTKLADQRKAKCEAENKAPDGEYQRGCLVIVARSKFQPKLSVVLPGKGGLDLNTPELIAMHKSKFFFGAEVLAQLNFVWHDEVGRNPAGVNCYINYVLATGKGTQLAGARSSNEVFKSYVGRVSAADPMAGQREMVDTELPF